MEARDERDTLGVARVGGGGCVGGGRVRARGCAAAHHARAVWPAADNQLGDAAGVAMANMLAKNATLTKLDVGGALWRAHMARRAGVL